MKLVWTPGPSGLTSATWTSRRYCRSLVLKVEVGTEGGDWVHRMGLVVQFWGLREAGNMKMRSGRSTSAQRLGVSALHKGPVAEWRWCGESRGERVEGRGAHHAQPAP